MSDFISHKFTSVYCLCCGHNFDVPIYCGDRFCQICGKKRRERVRKRIQFLIDQTSSLSGVTLKMFTLTIRSDQDLSNMIKHLVSSFRRLRSTKYWNKAVFGGCFVFEIKGRPGRWHAHIHGIVESYFLDWHRLRRLWLKSSGSPGIDIRAIHKSRSVSYITKYITKPAVDSSFLDDVNSALKGTRLFQPFGTWFNVNRKFFDVRPGCPECHQNQLALYAEVFGTGSFFEWKDVKTVSSSVFKEETPLIYQNPSQSELFFRPQRALPLEQTV